MLEGINNELAAEIKKFRDYKRSVKINQSKKAHRFWIETE